MNGCEWVHVHTPQIAMTVVHLHTAQPHGGEEWGRYMSGKVQMSQPTALGQRSHVRQEGRWGGEMSGEIKMCGCAHERCHYHTPRVSGAVAHLQTASRAE